MSLKELDTYFPSPLQAFVFMDKYARYRYDLGRRETWPEAVERVVNHLKKLSNYKLDQDTYSKIYRFILEMKVMPSMRLLAMAGQAAERNGICSYNCSFMGINCIEAFAEALYISIAGTGVGFSVEHKYIDKLPKLPKQLTKLYPYATFFIEDSSEGWYYAVKFLIKSLYGGVIPVLDYSAIRPAGAVLKIKGGRASGPGPLKETFDFIISVFQEAVDNKQEKLKSIQVHDIICSLGQAAVSGGVRRSAMSSIFDIDDEDMLKAKSGEYNNYRWNANNSFVWPEDDIGFSQYEKLIDSVFDNHNGEPGIWSKYAIKHTVPSRRDYTKVVGTNPCQPDFVYLLTPKGLRQLKDINIGDAVWSGKRWTNVANKVYTGNKPVYRYNTSFGNFIGTDSHRILQLGKKIEVKDAKSIDVSSCNYFNLGEKNKYFDYQLVMDGLVIGDGSVHKASNNLVYLLIGDDDGDYFESPVSSYILKYVGVSKNRSYKIRTSVTPDELPKTYDRVIPKRFFELNAYGITSFLRGLFSANGSVVDNGQRVTLKQSSRELILQVQIMLSSIGIKSYITENKPVYTQHRNGTYLSRTSYDLNITSDRIKFKEQIGFIQKYINDKIEGTVHPKEISATIKNTTLLGNFDVYDITVDDDEHTYWCEGLLVSNCFEISLRDMQFCNLSSVICRTEDTIDSLREKIEVATIIGTIQSMETNFPLLRPQWKYNCEDERLLGVDLNGQMDCPVLVCDKDGKIRDYLKTTAVATNIMYADKLGINRSTAVSAIKPNGNSSQLLDCSSGMHPRYSRFYTRNVRVGVHTPIYKVLFMSGVPLSPENGQTWENMNTAVASFPVKSPHNCLTRDDVTMKDMLEYWKLNKINYTEHNPSVTIFYKDNEKEYLKNWLWENKKIIGGLSFLPYSDAKYEQMPYIEITEEEYEKAVAEFPDRIMWELLEQFENEDLTTSSQELACGGSSSCDLK